MEKLKTLFILLLLCSQQVFATSSGYNLGFENFQKADTKDKVGVLDTSIVARIQFGSGGTAGQSGIYRVSLNGFTNSGCAPDSSENFQINLGVGHTTNPTTSIYDLTGTGLGLYLAASLPPSSYENTVSFQLLDVQSGSTSTCVNVTCGPSDCSTTDATPAILVVTHS